MAHDKDPVRIAPVVPCVVVGPPDCLRQVSSYVFHSHIGNETVVGRDEYKAPIQECPWLGRHIRFVAALPPAAMNPENDRLILAFGRSVDIKSPALLFWLE